MRSFLELSDVTGLTDSGASLERLAGGSTKGVYRLTYRDGGTALVYRWHPDENFWPVSTPIDGGPFVGRPGRREFLDKHRMLTALGVRVPEILALDRDLALIEDIRGGTLEALLERDPAAGHKVLGLLRETLLTMHREHGPLGFDGRPEEHLRDRGRRALAEAAPRVPRIFEIQDLIGYELSTRFSAIESRWVHGLIHGELGPDHVMVDDDGRPVLIDIEGTMMFDVEWEHAFLELRFGSLYAELRTVPLDPARMRLYRLVMYLSLVAGPLVLLDGDFPRPEGMREIVEWNIERVLAEIR